MQQAVVHVSILEARRASGEDRFDEVWDGVLHMVPPPAWSHIRLARKLARALDPVCDRRGLEVGTDPGLFDPDYPTYRNYRMPDVAVVKPDHASQRGIEGRAELVIEVLSPHDESREKLPFYARVGVREVWLVDPAEVSVEVHVCRADGTTLVQPTIGGVMEAPALGLVLAVVDAVLEIRDGEVVHRIEL